MVILSSETSQQLKLIILQSLKCKSGVLLNFRLYDYPYCTQTSTNIEIVTKNPNMCDNFRKIRMKKKHFIWPKDNSYEIVNACSDIYILSVAYKNIICKQICNGKANELNRSKCANQVAVLCSHSLRCNRTCLNRLGHSLSHEMGKHEEMHRD